MPYRHFGQLVSAICQAREIARTAMQDQLFHLRVEGVGCTLMPDTIFDAGDAVAFIVDYGPPPEASRGQALQQLMETNLYMFGPDTPRFACNPENGHVVYMGHVLLAAIEAVPLLQMLEQAARQALQWNVSLLMREEPASSRGPTSAVVRSVAVSIHPTGNTDHAKGR